MTSGNPLGDSCCNSSFQYSGSGTSFQPGWDKTQALLDQGQAALAQLNGTNATLTNLTTSTNTSSDASASSTSSSHDNHLGTAIGIGVGVPLAILAAGLLSFLFYKERNKHAQALAAVSGSSNASLGGMETRTRVMAAPSPTSDGSATLFYHPPPSRSNSGGMGTKTDVYSSSPGGMGYLDRKGSFGVGGLGQMGGMVMGSPRELSGEDRNETFSRQKRYEVPG